MKNPSRAGAAKISQTFTITFHDLKRKVSSSEVETFFNSGEVDDFEYDYIIAKEQFEP